MMLAVIFVCLGASVRGVLPWASAPLFVGACLGLAAYLRLAPSPDPACALRASRVLRLLAGVRCLLLGALFLSYDGPVPPAWTIPGLAVLIAAVCGGPRLQATSQRSKGKISSWAVDFREQHRWEQALLAGLVVAAAAWRPQHTLWLAAQMTAMLAWNLPWLYLLHATQADQFSRACGKPARTVRSLCRIGAGVLGLGLPLFWLGGALNWPVYWVSAFLLTLGGSPWRRPMSRPVPRFSPASRERGLHDVAVLKMSLPEGVSPNMNRYIPRPTLTEICVEITKQSQTTPAVRAEIVARLLPAASYFAQGQLKQPLRDFSDFSQLCRQEPALGAHILLHFAGLNDDPSAPPPSLSDDPVRPSARAVGAGLALGLVLGWHSGPGASPFLLGGALPSHWLLAASLLACLLAWRTPRWVAPKPVLELLQADPAAPPPVFELRLGRRFQRMWTTRRPEFLQRVADALAPVEQRYGMRLPAMQVKLDLALEPHRFEVRQRGIMMAVGSMEGELVAVGPAEALERAPEPRDNIIYGTQSCAWIRRKRRAFFEKLGCRVLDEPALLAETVAECVVRTAGQLLGLPELVAPLCRLLETEPEIAETLAQVSMSDFWVVCQRLLNEKVPIHDLGRIARAMAQSRAEHGEMSPDHRLEVVRRALAATIWESLGPGPVRAIELVSRPNDSVRKLEAVKERFQEKQWPLIFLSPNELRRADYTDLRRVNTTITVLSPDQIPPGVSLEIVERVA